MADKTIHQLDALTAADMADGDELVVYDVSAAAPSATKKTTLADVKDKLGVAGKQDAGANLTALAGLSGAADRLPYFTAAAAMALAALTTFGRSLIAAADAAGVRTLLALGTAAVQNASAFLQPGNNLSDVADVATARTNLGLGSAAVENTSAFLRPSANLGDLADAVAARSNLGLAIGGDVQAYDAELAALAGLTGAADKLPYFTGGGTAALADFVAFGRAVIACADAAALKTLLSLNNVVDVDQTDADNLTGGTVAEARLNHAILKSLLTTDGDMIYRSGGSAARLPAGNNGAVLTMVAGVPTWVGGGGPFTYDDWQNGAPGVTSHVWTLRLPKSYGGTTADLMLEHAGNDQRMVDDVSCDVDSAGLAAALAAWALDGGVPPAVNDAGAEWEWVITIDSANVPVDANRSASDFT